MLLSRTIGTIPKLLLLLVAGVALFSGCTMDTTVSGNIATGVFARTLTPTTIRVNWTRDPTDVTNDTVIVMNGLTAVDTTVVAYPLDSATVTGLASGINYTIIVRSATGNSSPIHFTLYISNVPTNVSVIAQTNVAITISWTRTATDTTADTLILLTNTGALAGGTPILIPAGTSLGVVTALVPGQAYIIIIASVTGRSSAISYTFPGLPLNLLVNAMSATSIGAKWTRGAGDTSLDTIVAMSGNSVVGTATTLGDSGIITGLTEGVPDSIFVHMSTGISKAMQWMPAERFTGLQIFEKNDSASSDPGALILAANGTKTIPWKGAANADFVLDEDTSVPSGLSFDAGSIANPAWNATKIDLNYFNVRGGLNNNYRDTAYNTSADTSLAHNIIPPDTTYNSFGSRILVCMTGTGNLALIEIVPDPSGKLYSVSSNGFKYITMNVSYQMVTNKPYAGRGRPQNSGHVVRRSAH